MKNRCCKIFLFFFIFTTISAQTINVSGFLNSKPDNIPLSNATLTFCDAKDTNNILSSITSDANGNFSTILTGIEEVNNSETSAKLNVFFSENQNGSLLFNITNPYGEKVEANIYSIATGQLVKSLDVSNNKFIWNKTNSHNNLVANGTYILQIKAGKEIINTKILKVDNYISIGSNLIAKPLLNNNKTELPKINSTIEEVLLKITAAGHEIYDTLISGTENHTLNIDVWKIANYKLDFEINTFNTAGERIKDTELLEAKYYNGELDTLVSDTAGKIKVLKRFYSELNDKKIQLTQINPNFLGWQTYLTTNKDKIEHITQNWNPNDAAIINGDEANTQKGIEIYVIPKRVQLPNGNYINMDSDTVKSIIGRDTFPDRDYSKTSKYEPSISGPNLYLIFPKFDLADWDFQVSENNHERSKNLTIKAADKLQLPEGKILIPYDTLSFPHWDSTQVDTIYARGFDNVMQSGFDYGSFEQGQINVLFVGDSMSGRIHDTRATYRHEEPNGTIFSTVLGALANLQAPFTYKENGSLVRPAGPLSDYVWDETKQDASEFGLHVMRIPYLFQIGTDYKNN